MNFIDGKILLNNYKRFDCLNFEKQKIIIKIFVSYIKPSFLFKSEILTPIHLGRAIAKNASKDGIISDDDLKWLYENCIGDDDFEGNISQVNRRVGFLTGTYWAWKNYEKLGNPEYFGSFGYRRLLNPDFLENLHKYDIILPKPRNLYPETIKEQFIRYHGMEVYQNMINVFETIYPQEKEQLEEYLDGNLGYFDEIYVMKKNVFFDFCSWIFPLLFEFLKHPQTKNETETRDIAFIMERLTGYYCYRLTQKKLAYDEENVIITEKMVVNPKLIKKDFFAMLRKNIGE